MFSPLFLRGLLSVLYTLIILLHFLGLGYRTISSVERLRVISTLSLRPNHEDVLGSRDQAPSSAVDWGVVSLTLRSLWKDTHSMGDRNKKFRYCSEEKLCRWECRGANPSYVFVHLESLYGLNYKGVKKQHRFSLRTRFVVAVQWRQISKIWCVNHLFFFAALEVLRKGGQV
jgi:hypothetical protein